MLKINIVMFVVMAAFFNAAFADNSPSVVTTIKPLYAVIAAVSRGAAHSESYLIVKGASSPHHYRLTPADAGQAKRADVIFAVGENFESFLTALRADGRLVLMETEKLPHRRDYLQEKHEEKHDKHHHGNIDPHIWLDPINGAHMAQVVADVLSEVNPISKDVYQRNAAAFREQMTVLDAQIAAILKPVVGRPFLTFHDAYGYFIERYGLSYEGAVSEAGFIRSRGFWRLKQDIDAKKIVCVMTEPQFPQDVIARLVADSKVKVGRLDPLGAEIPLSSDFYARLLKQMAEEFAECLSAD